MLSGTTWRIFRTPLIRYWTNNSLKYWISARVCVNHLKACQTDLTLGPLRLRFHEMLQRQGLEIFLGRLVILDPQQGHRSR